MVLALPSRYWYNRCNFCLAVTGAESIRLSNAFSHKKNLVLSESLPLKTEGAACGSRCNTPIPEKKPEVTPKRGLIALAVDTQSNKHGVRSGKASLSSNIPGVSVNKELTD